MYDWSLIFFFGLHLIDQLLDLGLTLLQNTFTLFQTDFSLDI